MSFHPDLGYFDEGADLTDPALYAAARGAYGDASILTPIAFRSRIFQELEDEKIWTREWCCIGWSDQIPSVGDLLPYTLGNHGVHVQREIEGLVGRFNFAQHGGCRFIPLQCQQGTKTKCSYTSCGYSRDRDVVRVVDLEEDTPIMRHFVGDRPERLIPVNVAQWGPLIFVNVDQRCETLNHQIGRLQSELDTSFESYRALHGFWSEHGGNWKLFGSLLMQSWCDQHARGAGISLLPDPREIDASDIPNYLLAKRAGNDDARESLLCWVYPNLFLEVDDSWLTSVIVQPTAIRQTMARVMIGGVHETADRPSNADELARRECWWRERLQVAGDAAAQSQIEQDEWGTPHRPQTTIGQLPAQTSKEAYALQRYLIDRLLTQYEYVWNAPLYTGGPVQAVFGRQH